MTVLNRKNFDLAPARHVKMLQFGEGNFLRAFVDWIVDISNAKGVTNLGIAIVKPRPGKSRVIDALNEQDCLYTVLLEGIENGAPKRTSRIISAVQDAFTPDDKVDFESYILSPNLRFVVSNTTEAGIRYEEDDVREDPHTFPGRVTNLLWRRYNHFNGDPSRGLFFLPCELIEDNGTTLREYVLRHIEAAGLDKEFADWVKDACVFADTLVDRIVSGAPEDAEKVKAELGYDDNIVVNGELYHVWAIGGEDVERIHTELPLDEAGLNVLFLPSVKEFRDKKVRILNGSHTGMVAISLLSGHETVREAFEDEDINKFINAMVDTEVLPVIDGDREELKRFADGILERFYNPYIRHRLESIALNSLSKWEARNLDTLLDNWTKFSKYAEKEIITFAALLYLYSPETGFVPQDNAEHIAFITENWDKTDYPGTVRKIVSGSGIFLKDFEALVPGFSDRVAGYLSEITKNGIKSVLK